MSRSDLRRRLTEAIDKVLDEGVDPGIITDEVMAVLIHQPLMIVLSGLSEEVINRRHSRG